MSLQKVYSLYKSMDEENVILSFKGVVTADLLTSILQIMESRMESSNESPRVRKKVFNVLVECLQNLYHHADDYPDGRTALVMIAKEGNAFTVRTGNYIDNERAEDLKERLKIINTMDKEGLKEYYQNSLESSVVSSKGTAGLGMIDIARKSGNKLDFEFLNIDNERSFFCLNVKID
jgi:hypothetical protein